MKIKLAFFSHNDAKHYDATSEDNDDEPRLHCAIVLHRLGVSRNVHVIWV